MKAATMRFTLHRIAAKAVPNHSATVNARAHGAPIIYKTRYMWMIRRRAIAAARSCHMCALAALLGPLLTACARLDHDDRSKPGCHSASVAGEETGITVDVRSNQVMTSTYYAQSLCTLQRKAEKQTHGQQRVSKRGHHMFRAYSAAPLACTRVGAIQVAREA